MTDRNTERKTHEATVQILNELGMHARAATKFVKLASRFPCDVTLEKDGKQANGKSIMSVLMLVASKGTSVTIRATGAQAQEAVEALSELIADRFGEDR